jgi:hypothetical protein
MIFSEKNLSKIIINKTIDLNEHNYKLFFLFKLIILF